MCSVAVNTPKAVLCDTRMTARDAQALANSMTALDLYRFGDASIGSCAEVAGLTEEEFIELLGKNKVDVFRFEDDELLRDVANA